MSSPAFLEVAFLPWVGLREEVRIGRVVVWPFQKYAEARISDSKVLEHLRKYFSCYVNSLNQPVDSVAICSIDGHNFNALSDADQIILRRAVDSLCFATVAHALIGPVTSDNFSWAPPDVDCFLLYFQRFTPGDDSVAVKSGYVTSFGPTIDQLRFQQPSWVSQGLGINSRDDELLSSLGMKLLLKSWNKPAARVFNALEWFRLAHTGGDHISFEPRIVMTASAFESLIDLPRNQKKFPLMEAIDKRHFGEKLYQKSYTIKNVTQKFSLAAAFIFEFYELRNSIAHGDRIRPRRLRYSIRTLRRRKKGAWLTRQIVADLLLYEIVWRAVVKRNEIWKLEWKFDSVHRALGWKRDL